jgi:hypothetical protein
MMPFSQNVFMQPLQRAWHFGNRMALASGAATYPQPQPPQQRTGLKTNDYRLNDLRVIAQESASVLSELLTAND